MANAAQYKKKSFKICLKCSKMQLRRYRIPKFFKWACPRTPQEKWSLYIDLSLATPLVCHVAYPWFESKITSSEPPEKPGTHREQSVLEQMNAEYHSIITDNSGFLRHSFVTDDPRVSLYASAVLCTPPNQINIDRNSVDRRKPSGPNVSWKATLNKLF